MSETSQANGRKPHIGVLMPAGKVINHDHVVTHTFNDPQKATQLFTNIGDCFVYESSLRILDYAELFPIYAPATGDLTEKQVDKINTLDYIFLRGSNYINTNGQWDPITRVLEKTKVPVIAFGIGVQVPDNSEEYVNESTKRFLQVVADRSVTLGVRGELSRTALKSIGINNVRVFGCPTMFRHCKPSLNLKRVSAGDIKNLGFTLRRKTYGFATLQRYMLRTLADRYNTEILCAGELEEKTIFYANRKQIPDSEKAMAGAVKALVEDKWIYGAEDPLLKLYLSSLSVFETVQDFEEAEQKLDAVTGFRLHGNLLALANEIPALYVTYDTRTREFVKTLGIPFVDGRHMDRFSFEEAWDSADFDHFEKTYIRRFGELKAFLEENSMAHRLGGDPTPNLIKAA
ncbi:polysaccharide pyruvyl transferase family protein [Thalassospira sp.]|uniref:polysaccharide pyruvyl transferase family protein n=1 Tax=Thalassospira sp. TaxID=1912094 RepID=UPI002733A23D|nr:polysaccharide pyruvyl transferase family protein [Thalassospira sp.]MDP2698126.1 polysaccharide pyruvyl transferase family protein [Thalassospira sp.]